MVLGVLNTIFLNISNYLSHLELRVHFIQTANITSFVVLSNVSIKKSEHVTFNPMLFWGYNTLLKVLQLSKLTVGYKPKLDCSCNNRSDQHLKWFVGQFIFSINTCTRGKQIRWICLLQKFSSGTLCATNIMKYTDTPQLLNNTVIWVQSRNHVS